MLQGISVPLANSWEQMRRMPALLVGDYLIMTIARQEAEAWRESNPETPVVADQSFGGNL